MVQFDSCISSKPFRAWLFIKHVDPVKRIQRQAIKNLHFWTLAIVHYQFQAMRWHWFITASDAAAVHNMQRNDTFIKNRFVSIAFSAFENFHFLSSKPAFRVEIC